MARSYELTEAVASLIHRHPFFAVLLLDLLEIQETTSVPTAGTDSKYLYVNPDFFKNRLKNCDERVFVLAHEVMHVVMGHPSRLAMYVRQGYGPDLKEFSIGKMNRAMDYIINDMLVDSKVGLCPPDALINPRFTKDMIADEVYPQLPDDPDDANGGGGFDTHMPANPQSTHTKQQLQRAMQSAASAAKAMGKMPGGMQRLVDEFCDPGIKWDELLRKTYVTTAGRDQASWNRPNRRKLAVPPHIIWPGRAGAAAGPVVMGIDTSGSIGEELKLFLGAVHSIMTDMPPESLTVMFIDAEVAGVEHIEDINDVLELGSKVAGGGGTHMPAIFPKIQELGLQPATVFILTDGYTDFGEDQGIPTVWCITTPSITAPWGTTIHIGN